MAETKDRERMRELAEILDAASRAYYNGPEEIMSNKDYDRLYEELEALEKKTGTVLTVSPTHKVGYEVLDELP
jgi:DNA ligase (NAD+)